jgi:hypothetical protein
MAVVDAMTTQRYNESRCRARIGDELLTLQAAGGAWSEMADWTNLDERTVRTLARTPKPKDIALVDEELTSLTAEVPDNPFFRVCELLTASRFFAAVADELDDVTNWLCFELSTAGIDRSTIARRAHFSQLTLARRITRAKRSGWQPNSRRSTS